MIRRTLLALTLAASLTTTTTSHARTIAKGILIETVSGDCSQLDTTTPDGLPECSGVATRSGAVYRWTLDPSGN